MEKEQNPTSNFLANLTFDPDLVPMYALTEQQYQMIINNLASLVIVMIKEIQGDNQHLAQLIAQHAYEILCDYDDDVAEMILWEVRKCIDIIKLEAL